MKNSEDGKKKVTIEEIEKMAVRGEDVTQFFDMKNGKMHPGYGKLERVRKDIQRVNVDFSQLMLGELDKVSEELSQLKMQRIIRPETL